MKAKNESTKFFVEKTGDRIYMECKVTGNPDQVISALMKSMSQDCDLVDGLAVTQVLFRGKDINGVIDNARKTMLNAMEQQVIEFNNEFHVQL